MTKNSVFLLFPSCKLVKGYARSAVYDLEARALHLISNSAYTFIKESIGKTYDEISSLFKETDKKVVDSLIASLLEKHLIRFVDKDDYPHFLPMQQYSQPESLLNNFVIDIDHDSGYDIYNTIEKISIFRLQVIQIRFLYTVEYEQLVQITNSVYNKGINSIEIVLPFSVIQETQNLYNLLDIYQNVTNLYFWGSPTAKIEKYKQCQIIFTETTLNSDNSCGFVSKNSFLCNKRFYFEAQSCNTCLSKKCSIDKKGIIKNCPYMSYGFGHINDNTSEELEKIVQKNEFTQLFTIKKDDIQTCNVCEFRYACFDCRAFLSDKDNLLSKPAKCNYNPYVAKWENNV